MSGGTPLGGWLVFDCNAGRFPSGVSLLTTVIVQEKHFVFTSMYQVPDKVLAGVFVLLNITV